MYANAQYSICSLSGAVGGIRCVINGMTSYIPLDPANSDYRRIMALVNDGKLTIADPE